MNIYENIVIFNPTMDEVAIEQAIKSVENLIIQNQGNVLEVQKWGMRKLAYELNRHKNGFYVLFLFKAQPSFVKKLEEYYRLQDSVIKFMVIKLGRKEIEAIQKKETGVGEKT